MATIKAIGDAALALHQEENHPLFLCKDTHCTGVSMWDMERVQLVANVLTRRKHTERKARRSPEKVDS